MKKSLLLLALLLTSCDNVETKKTEEFAIEYLKENYVLIGSTTSEIDNDIDNMKTYEIVTYSNPSCNNYTLRNLWLAQITSFTDVIHDYEIEDNIKDIELTLLESIKI